MNKNKGFTTIELVTVIIIVGILAVNVLPKFDGTSGYQTHTHRAQLISALRLTQQRAMQQTNPGENFCHQLIIEADRYGIANRVAVDCSGQDIMDSSWQPDLSGHIVEPGNLVTFSLDGSASKNVTFDWLGKPGGDCAGGCTIKIAGETSALDVEIKIEAEGYIRGI